MTKRDVHVTPHPKGGWQTRTEGVSRAGSLHPTQKSAFEQAREQAVRTGVELVIHRPNGRIRDSNSYGNDPFPPKG